MKVLFYVQHLLGIGHVRRAALIARALCDAGFEVVVAQGGVPVAGTDYGAARLVQLPPARAADASFRPILDEAGNPIDDGWRGRRAAQLLALHEAERPDVVLVETFPFGRRAFRFELEPLLRSAAARPDRPLIAASVRDILVAKDDPARHAEMAAAAERWFDLILVHGDPALIPFGATFREADRIAGRLRYTGYVAPQRRTGAPGTDGAGEVLVSVGGGAVGARLLETALAARPLTALAGTRWRLLVGPDLPAASREALVAAAPPGVVVEPARPDFPALLERCLLSVSQAGYNTVLDLLAAGCRSVLVPFAAGAETEQALRARLLAARGLATVVDEATLDAAGLAAAIRAALAGPRPPRPSLAMDGAAETARLIGAALAGRGLPEDVRADL